MLLFVAVLQSCVILWDLCKSYGLQLFAISALGFLTVYRREISCNNIYHHSTATAHQQPSSRPSTSKRRRQQHQLAAAAARTRLLVTTPIEVDQWLLLEHCCYGLAFGPLLSLVSFICRTFTLSLASLWNNKRRNATPSKTKPSLDSCDEKKEQEEEEEFIENNSASLRNALAHEWSLCQYQGFHCTPSIVAAADKQQRQQQQQLIKLLPRDVQFLMLAFLSVNDVLVYGRTCKYSNNLVYNGTVAYPLWNMLTLRDFHDFIHWDVAQQRYYECTTRATTATSRQRQLVSNTTCTTSRRGSYPILTFLDNWHTQWATVSSSTSGVDVEENDSYKKSNTPSAASADGSFLSSSLFRSSRSSRRRVLVYEMYFTIYVTCIPWSLALRNTTHCCLVGLYNAVYCITSFLPDHPGSVETLLVHSGTDASRTFEAVGHSTRAHILADTMCVWKVTPLGGNPPASSISEHRAQWRQRRHTTNNNSNMQHTNYYNSSLLSSLQHQASSITAEYYNNNNNDDDNDDDSSLLASSIVHYITEYLSKDEKNVRSIIEKSSLHLEAIIVGDTIHLFYDPFIQLWCCWYTSLTTDGELEPVMIYVDE